VKLPYDAGLVRVSERLRKKANLAPSSLRGEFSLLYQPIFALESGTLRKAEALLRWTDPTEGLVEAARFVPELEQDGLICPIGEWVLGQACVFAREWRLETGDPMRVTVNVSPLQLESGDFPSTAERILRENRCEPASIELEITEDVLIRDFASAKRRLEELSALGFTLAIDDFGSGYSSLGQLAALPVHHLKIDRSLIRGVPADRKKTEIVSAVVAMAKALGLTATVEGVEKEEQATAWADSRTSSSRATTSGGR
jgi:EAL domain-containing protein (putative c-di-GMP-specific phosphodiesterase class I)